MRQSSVLTACRTLQLDTTLSQPVHGYERAAELQLLASGQLAKRPLSVTTKSTRLKGVVELSRDHQRTGPEPPPAPPLPEVAQHGSPKKDLKTQLAERFDESREESDALLQERERIQARCCHLSTWFAHSN